MTFYATRPTSYEELERHDQGHKTFMTVDTTTIGKAPGIAAKLMAVVAEAEESGLFIIETRHASVELKWNTTDEDKKQALQRAQREYDDHTDYIDRYRKGEFEAGSSGEWLAQQAIKARGQEED